MRKGTGAGIPSPKRLLGEKGIARDNNNNSVPAEAPPKLVFRSAMKATNYTNNSGKNNNDGSSSNNQPPKSKLVRYIQLPTENFDDDESEQAPEINHSPKGDDSLEMVQDDQVDAERAEQSEQAEEEEQGQEQEQEQEQGQEQEQEQEQEREQEQEQEREQEREQEQKQEREPVEDAIANVVTAPTTPTVPGPSRFTRISKKTLSPAKKLNATIPTPLDDGTEQVQKNIKELKAMLGRLGLLPLSATLESSMDGLDAATLEKGGLCETLTLLQKLGGMCEKQKEVIDQMTDQIIANETQAQREDPKMEGMIQRMADELEDVKAELNETNKRNRVLEVRSTEATMELEKLRSSKETSTQASATETKVQSLDAATEISGNWGSIEELLDQRGEGFRISRSKKTAAQNQQRHFEEVPAKWRGHIQKIEQELHAFKATLDRHPSSSSSGATTSEVDGLEDRLNEVLLDNGRLKQKNKSLTRELLNLHDDGADQELKDRASKYKMLLKDIMARLGVENHKQILPALNEIERMVQDLPNLRRFIAKTERIIWESEIIEGTVKVQKYSRGGMDGPESLDIDSKGPIQKSSGDPGLKGNGGAGLVIKVGRTCSQSLEETLQRLQEWSELLDVLNHVEFADNSNDTFVAPIS
ncbi:hypothetical protein EDD21DRAFT_157084 [Dissophora ornata]|nr:hypothetical protein EDD21DRAFT_157084 [Dissophora ornata]